MSQQEDQDAIVVYNEVDEAKSIINTLVNNIYYDETYQEYLKELQDSDAKNSNKKVANIENTFSTIKVFNSNTEPLFLSQDIGIIVGAANVKQMIKNYTNTEKIEGYIKIGSKIYKKEFLTKHGVYRILLTNRTKLSDVFRKFIYELLDHMYNNEIDKLKSIIKEFNIKNKDLVNEAAAELTANIKNYKELYEIEQRERIALESELNITDMQIAQLKSERDAVMAKIIGRKQDHDLDESIVALEILKKKFMKEVSIYLVQPAILEDLFKNPKSQYSYKNESFMLDDYINEFPFLTRNIKHGSSINDDRIFYLSIAYTPKKSDDDEQPKKVKKDSTSKQKDPIKDSTKDKDIINLEIPDNVYVASTYVFNNSKFNELVEIMKEECDYYQISKTKKSVSNFIFRTTIEHINLIARNLIIE
jgi:hypothetical protein